MNSIPSRNPHSPFFVIGRQSGAAVMNLHTGEIVVDNLDSLRDADEHAARLKAAHDAPKPVTEEWKRATAQALGLIDPDELAALREADRTVIMADPYFRQEPVAA